MSVYNWCRIYLTGFTIALILLALGATVWKDVVIHTFAYLSVAGYIDMATPFYTVRWVIVTPTILGGIICVAMMMFLLICPFPSKTTPMDIIRYAAETEREEHIWDGDEYKGALVTYANPLDPALKTVFHPYIPLTIYGQPTPKVTRAYFIEHGWPIPGEPQSQEATPEIPPLIKTRYE
jgi:hypothetical protein